MSLRHNIVANYIGQVWRVLVLLAFVPLYIKYLGIEAYGLIGVFAVMQAWLSFLDLGARPTIAREMARYAAGAHNGQAILNLLRSVETVLVLVAILMCGFVWLASGWLSESWVKAGTLAPSTIENAFKLMAFVVALRFVESIYSSSLSGLQRQVTLNIISIIMTTLQGLGGVAVLAWISPTIEMFFGWQLLVSLLTVVVLGLAVYKALPVPRCTPRFSWDALREVRRFAAGMLGISLTALVLTQIDKLLLSHWMPLEVFGYYILASLVASGLDMFTAPVAAAVYPHFIDLLTKQKNDALRQVYHHSAQLITVFTASVAAVLMLYPDRVLSVWTGDATLSQHVAPIMTLLVLGTLLHCMIWVPYQLQLAHGWTSLAVGANVVSIMVLMPALVCVVPTYGAIGVAWIWVALNAGYILISMQVMHRAILPGEKWEWYCWDVSAPGLTAVAAAWLSGYLLPTTTNRLVEFLMLAILVGIALAASVLMAPSMRRSAIKLVARVWERRK